LAKGVSDLLVDDVQHNMIFVLSIKNLKARELASKE